MEQKVETWDSAVLTHAIPNVPVYLDTGNHFFFKYAISGMFILFIDAHI